MFSVFSSIFFGSDVKVKVHKKECSVKFKLTKVRSVNYVEFSKPEMKSRTLLRASVGSSGKACLKYQHKTSMSVLLSS